VYTSQAQDDNVKQKENNEIHELKLTCMLNLAMCYTKLSDWATCIRACNRALQLDPRNVKALYRRAQARTIPAYCGTVENQMALEDLKRAVSIKPDDPMLTATYADLKITLAEQKKKDKQTFSNLFNRKDGDENNFSYLDSTSSSSSSSGAAAASSSSSSAQGRTTSTGVASSGSRGIDTCTAPSASAPNPAMTWQHAFNLVADMESAAERCDRDGHKAQAAAIRAKKASLQQNMLEHLPANMKQAVPSEAGMALLGRGTSSSGSGSSSRTSSSSTTTTAAGNDQVVQPRKLQPKGATAAATGVLGPAQEVISAAKWNELKLRFEKSQAPLVAQGNSGSGSSSSSSGSNGTRSSPKNAAGSGRSGGSGGLLSATGGAVELDFLHPTPEMVADAKKNGLDLTDPKVQQVMQEINRVRVEQV
jgi:hypothetical protein